MAENTSRRKRAFRVALAQLEETATGFARDHGVSTTHLYEVLAGRRVPGAELNAAIDALIKRAAKQKGGLTAA